MSSDWLPAELPARFEHDGLVFVPLTPALVVPDYAAVMRDVPLLRAWSGQDWPTPEFTIAENLADLERHDREQQGGIALTYSVLLDGAVQGCVYARPFADAWRTRGAEPPVGQFAGHVAVRGWLHDRSAADLVDATLALLGAPRFAFRRVWWQTNSRCPEQVAACAALGLTDEVKVAGEAQVWMALAAPQDGGE